MFLSFGKRTFIETNNLNTINFTLYAALSSHASIRYDEEDIHHFCNSPFDYIKKYDLFKDNTINDKMIENFLNYQQYGYL